MVKQTYTAAQDGGLIETYRARGYLFRGAMATGFVCGLYIHSTRLLFGIDMMRAHLLTPTVDVVFGLLLLYMATASIAAWRLVAFRNRAERFRHTVITIFVAISVPLHLSVLFTHSTAYTNLAPWWYSAAELPIFSVFIFVETRLRLQSELDGPR